jgi:NDP-sugar pyrophosphorylase family protein
MGLNVKADLDRCKIIPPVYIGGSAEIQHNSTLIGPLVIGAGALVESGSHLEETVVMDHTRVGAQAFFKGRIVGSRYCASAEGTVLDSRHTDTSWLFADARSDQPALNSEQQQVLDLLAEANR